VKRSAQTSLHVYDGTARGSEPLALAETADADVAAVIAELEEEMQEAAGKLEFERAAVIRDQINTLKSGDFKRAAGTAAGAGSKKRRSTARGPRGT
jgi:excinuclease ABC subunit B